MLTGRQIAEDALAIQRSGAGYIWGTSGEIWTEKKQKELYYEYWSDPVGNASKYGSMEYGDKWIGKPVYDCSGLVMRICANHGLKLPHGSNSQFNKYCKASGKLKKGKRKDGQELKIGTCVFLYKEATDNRHHVGIYCGNTIVVEAKGGKWGVITSNISAWDEWGELKNVDYSNEQKDGGDAMDYPTLRRGDTGEWVTKAQELLQNNGSEIQADGIFGIGTQTAVKAFQRKNGLDSDGIIGPKTWAMLMHTVLNVTVDKDADMTEVIHHEGRISITLDMESAKQIFLALKAAGVEACL